MDVGQQLVRVVFQPGHREARVSPGQSVLAAAVEAHALIDAPCAGRRACGKCKVRAFGGLSPLTIEERDLLTPVEIEQGWRLACKATIESETRIMAPRRPMKAVWSAPARVHPDPAVRKVCTTVPNRSSAAEASMTDRALRAAGLADLRWEVPLLRQLACTLTQGTGTVTFTVADGQALDLEPGDTSTECYGVAFDIGTTTVVGSLMDLTKGEEVAVAAAANEQSSFGADVIARISLALSDPSGLDKLQRAVLGVLNRLLSEMVDKSGVSRNHIYEATVVGNTCMHHLALGLLPASLGVVPFDAVIVGPVSIDASALGLAIHPKGRVYFLPNVRSFVGSDTVAVALALNLHRRPGPLLAVDIGTNAEVVVGWHGRLKVASTAAGPAFEGAQISCGMRATSGAIEQVRITAEGDVLLQAIGKGRPTGICGSGLIDALAELRGASLIDPSGRLVTPQAGQPGYHLLKRLTEYKGERAFRLASGIYLTQGDIRQLQLAKAATRAGIEILMKHLAVTEQDVRWAFLAGAFGTYCRPESVLAIGLLPSLPRGKVVAVGNAASAGAKMALLNQRARRWAGMIARRLEHVSLSQEPDFQDKFIAAIAFPPL